MSLQPSNEPLNIYIIALSEELTSGVMTEDPRFGPSSPFGVPVTPFMPGVRWKSLEQLLADVFCDLNNEQCRNFLLKLDPLEDVRILTAHAYNYNVPNLEGVIQHGSNKAVSIEPFSVPTMNFANLAVGIFITRHRELSGATKTRFSSSHTNWYRNIRLRESPASKLVQICRSTSTFYNRAEVRYVDDSNRS